VGGSQAPGSTHRVDSWSYGWDVAADTESQMQEDEEGEEDEQTAPKEQVACSGVEEENVRIRKRTVSWAPQEAVSDMQKGESASAARAAL